jgi:penicillin-binding protein 1B
VLYPNVAIKLKIPRSSGKNGLRFLPGDPVVRAALFIFLSMALVVAVFFSYFYVKYDRLIEKRFSSPLFSNAAKIYALPKSIHPGEKADVQTIAAELRRAGYSEQDRKAAMGSFEVGSGGIEVTPGPESYHSSDPARITIRDGKIEKITSRGSELSGYELEPVLVTSLFDADRSKRQIVKYGDIPKVLVDAVTAIEDRRFFQHSGVNFVRLAEAFWIDVTRQRHEQGGSTITMQLSRAFFLTPEKTIRRKLSEIMISLELEQKFSKQQIFEFYANRVDLGQRGSFTISGFAQASQAYFNKDLKDITLPEAALIAGLIQAPSYLSPYRHPERALERRNVVLDSMADTHAITHEQAERAKATPLKLAPPNVEASDAPYFVDLVRDNLVNKFSDHELNDQAYRVYTTLDPDLQRVAAQAVESGVKLVDEQVAKMRTKKVKLAKGKYETHVAPGPQAQVALVAIDPHTGQVLALVGGRNYGMSQLNHAIAKRPTGSIFKPFVYAAAMNTALDGATSVLTPASTVDDSASTFAYGDQIYEPRNYKEEYHGQVTLREALAHSLNNATVKLAEEVGYDKVAELAKTAGIASVKATPAMALGAYDATPIDMAGAYTVFANDGVRISPIFIDSVRNAKGDVVQDYRAEKRQVLDPRISYIMTNMMEGVMNFGTAAGVRARGFTAPAAGKTGSSHDGWFAGYTSNLLCIVWVGYDDYSDLHLSGAQTAAPVWAEFMKKAVALPQYSGVKPFGQPTGVVDVQLDKATNRLATPACPETYTAAFVAGTEPRETCDQSTGVARVFSHIFGLGGQKALPPPGSPDQASADQAPGAEKKKKGFFGKIAGIFKEDKSASQPSKPADSSGAPPQ